MEEAPVQPTSPEWRVRTLAAPLTIVAAGALIAGGIFFGNAAPRESTGAISRGTDALLRGNADAPIRVIEFSDFECPFCARLHPTLERIQREHPDRIAWEYRHLPLPNHKHAESAALAGECIGELAGNDAFWSFADAAFNNQRNLGTALYEQEAARHDIDGDALAACMSDPDIQKRVAVDYQDAVRNGGNGTPFVIIRFEDGSTKTFTGALPYEQVRALLAP